MLRSEVKQVCESANSTDEMLQAFKKLELNTSTETELGMECWKLAYDFHQQGKDPEKILFLGNKGLKALINLVKNSAKNSNYSLVLARLLHLLGCVCHQLNKFSQSLSYLNWAVRSLLARLEEVEEKDTRNGCHSILSEVYFELSRVKKAVGRIDEAYDHLRESFLFKEMVGQDRGSLGMARAYLELASWYWEVKNYEEAVSFFLKAEEIYMECCRPDSEVLLQVRKKLVLIYNGELDEEEKALELNELRLSVLRSKGCSSDLIDAELLSCSILIGMHRCDEAVKTLKDVVSLAEKAGEDGARATAFTFMAKACAIQGKFGEAKKYIRIALRIIEKKDIDSGKVVMLLNEMSLAYQHMEEYESVISVLRRVLATADISENLIIDCCFRLIEIGSLTGNEKMCMEDAAERLKETLGPYHVLVGSSYIHLGAFYLDSGRPDTAAKYLVLAKGVMDVSLSPQQLESVTMSHHLSVLYAVMGSYSLAMECEEKVIKVLKGLGPSQQDFLDEAVEQLNVIKKKASGEGEVSQE